MAHGRRRAKTKRQRSKGGTRQRSRQTRESRSEGGKGRQRRSRSDEAHEDLLADERTHQLLVRKVVELISV